MMLIGGNLTYKTGETTQTNYTYTNTTLDSSIETTTYVYSGYQDSSGFFTSHRLGYLLAVLSVIGMIGSFVSIRREGFFK